MLVLTEGASLAFVWVPGMTGGRFVIGVGTPYRLLVM